MPVINGFEILLANSSENRALKESLSSTLALLDQFTASLTAGLPAPDAKTVEESPNPLRILAASATLIKGQTTNISLLILERPFPTSAITRVVRELIAKCLPHMMNAVQICNQEGARWSRMLCKEVQIRVTTVFSELKILLKEVLTITEGLAWNARRDQLTSTGIVWQGCDALVELEALGLGGIALKRAQQYRETLQDAINELQEWAEGEDLDTEGREDRLLDSDDEGVGGDQDSIDNIFNAANSMPTNRPELKELADHAVGKLKKIEILYSALVKRRLGTFDNTKQASESRQPQVERLDDLMMHLRRIPFQVDELAGCFYDLDHQTANDILKKCLGEAVTASKLMELNWDDREDTFTSWLGKWASAVG